MKRKLKKLLGQAAVIIGFNAMCTFIFVWGFLQGMTY